MSKIPVLGDIKLLFGVNFADGRIKGYGLTMPGSGTEKTFLVQCVRGATYGVNDFADYTRSPDTTSSAAINALFTSTSITNEAGQVDYPFYWTSTTHMSSTGVHAAAVYLAFGRAMGYMSAP